MTEVKVTVADLINGELLKPGTVVVLRTLEGVITDQGTIRAAGANGLGVVDYRTPTAWSRVVCKINSSGWRQVKLKDEKTSLYTLKQKYIQRKGGDAKEDKPAKRQKTPSKSHVPNINHIPQQLQFIPHPLQQQLNQQQTQNQIVSIPVPIVTPPKTNVLIAQGAPTDSSDPNNPNGPTSSALISAPSSTGAASQAVVEAPHTPAPSSSYMKFKLTPTTPKTKMLELLVYIEDPTMIPFMLNTTASSFDSLHYVLLESFPQYRGKQFDIGVWSDQWGEFVKPPPSWDQFPSKTKIIVKTFPFRWGTREYEPPSTTSTTAAAPGTPTGAGASAGAASTQVTQSPAQVTQGTGAEGLAVAAPPSPAYAVEAAAAQTS